MIKKRHIAYVLLANLMAGSSAFAASDTSGSVENGHQIYKDRCMHCHGPDADGKGHATGHLNITPTNLTILRQNSAGDCVSKKVLGAVLGRHATGTNGKKMPLMKQVLSLEDVYAVTEYVESIQK